MCWSLGIVANFVIQYLNTKVRRIGVNLAWLGVIFLFMTFLCAGCSDFYKKDFVHVPSAFHEADRSQKEREIQAMRKSQILEDNHTRVLMIARYMNEIDKRFIQAGEGEVFLVEVYDKRDELDVSKMTFQIHTPYNSLESLKVEKLNINDLGSLAPDIAYNDVYRVVFDTIGVRGKDGLKLLVEVKGIGSMSFDFGYAKRKSKLTQ